MAKNKGIYPKIDIEKIRLCKFHIDDRVLAQMQAVASMLKSFSKQSFDEQTIRDAALVASVATCRMEDNNTFSFSKVSLFMTILETVDANKTQV